MPTAEGLISNEQDLALAQLHALVAVPGALKVITNEVQPDLRQDPDDPRSPAQDGVDLRDPATFVIHNVTRIQDPDDRGRVRAYTDEGDYCEGYPTDVLRRLTEVGR